jgi:hypothetical protein
LTQFDSRRLWIGGLLGFVYVLAVAELVYGRWSRLLSGEWSIREPCIVAVVLAFWVTVGRGTVYLIESARLYSQIGERHVAVDLLDLAPLSPLTRHGLRVVLLLTIATAASVFVVIPGTQPALVPRIETLLTGCLWSAILGAAVFLLPVRGLRRHIRARKAEELSRLRERIRRNRELAEGSGAESAEAGAKLPGLLAYKHEIESVREWPFDAPTLTRFFLYVAIPLGSWIGGALVERLLGAALD